MGRSGNWPFYLDSFTIIDFYNKTYDKLKLPKTLPKNFQVLNKKVILEGLCKRCKPSKGGLNS